MRGLVRTAGVLGSPSCSGATCCGSRTLNVLPWPTWLVTAMWPPISSVSWRAMVVPSPVPP
ncbi:hypothetical protein D3C71_1817360 [compost metagenome]